MPKILTKQEFCDKSICRVVLHRMNDEFINNYINRPRVHLNRFLQPQEERNEGQQQTNIKKKGKKMKKDRQSTHKAKIEHPLRMKLSKIQGENQSSRTVPVGLSMPLISFDGLTDSSAKNSEDNQKCAVNGPETAIVFESSPSPPFPQSSPKRISTPPLPLRSLSPTPMPSPMPTSIPSPMPSPSPSQISAQSKTPNMRKCTVFIERMLPNLTDTGTESASDECPLSVRRIAHIPERNLDCGDNKKLIKMQAGAEPIVEKNGVSKQLSKVIETETHPDECPVSVRRIARNDVSKQLSKVNTFRVSKDNEMELPPSSLFARRVAHKPTEKNMTKKKYIETQAVTQSISDENEMSKQLQHVNRFRAAKLKPIAKKVFYDNEDILQINIDEDAFDLEIMGAGDPSSEKSRRMFEESTAAAIVPPASMPGKPPIIFNETAKKQQMQSQQQKKPANLIQKLLPEQQQQPSQKSCIPMKPRIDLTVPNVKAPNRFEYNPVKRTSVFDRITCSAANAQRDNHQQIEFNMNSGNSISSNAKFPVEKGHALNTFHTSLEDVQRSNGFIEKGCTQRSILNLVRKYPTSTDKLKILPNGQQGAAHKPRNEGGSIPQCSLPPDDPSKAVIKNVPKFVLPPNGNINITMKTKHVDQPQQRNTTRLNFADSPIITDMFSPADPRLSSFMDMWQHDNRNVKLSASECGLFSPIKRKKSQDSPQPKAVMPVEKAKKINQTPETQINWRSSLKEDSDSNAIDSHPPLSNSIKANIPLAIIVEPAESTIKISPPPPISLEPLLGGDVCLPYLNNLCKNSTNCAFRHFLPAVQDIRLKLDELGPDWTEKVYNLRVQHCRRLLDKYFGEFCFFMGTNGRQKQLQIMLKCIFEKKIYDKCRYVVDSLITTGFAYSDILSKLMELNDNSEKAMKMILNFICDVRNEAVGDYVLQIEIIAKQLQYKFDAVTMASLDRICESCPNDTLLEIRDKAQLDN